VEIRAEASLVARTGWQYVRVCVGTVGSDPGVKNEAVGDGACELSWDSTQCPLLRAGGEGGLFTNLTKLLPLRVTTEAMSSAGCATTWVVGDDRVRRRWQATG